MAPTYEELEILAKRNYHGLTPSGMCSKSHKGKTDYSCRCCFPDYESLCGTHNELKQKAWAALSEIAKIIEAVDNRCAAADGPVTPTLREMTQEELSRIYELAKKTVP